MISVILSQTALIGSAADITVSAAMSLKGAFEAIGKQYEVTRRGEKILLNFGASGDLMRQIEGGAPVDVFVSASKSEIVEVERKGLVIPGSTLDFASNDVVLIVPLHKNAGMKSFGDLGSKAVKKIAMGNPKSVPAGRYAREVLTYYKVLPSVQDKMVFAENVRQVLDYVARGEVDAGIVYATDAVGSNEVTVMSTAPATSHEPILYSSAVVKGTRNERRARAFMSLLTSAEGARIFRRYGFVTRRDKGSGPKR